MAPSEKEIQDLAMLVQQEVGFVQVELAGGDVRLRGKDVTVAVAKTADHEVVFSWAPKKKRWRVRPDLDPVKMSGLIEWRRLREQTREDEYDDNGEYDFA